MSIGRFADDLYPWQVLKQGAESRSNQVMIIGQYDATTRNPALYTFAVDKRSGTFNSSVLLAYKLNWQTVVYAGYGDGRTYDEASDKLQNAGRQVFTKVSYAWQL